MKRKRLGEVLRESGKLSEAALQEALQKQQGQVVRLGELLLRGGTVPKKDLIAALNEVTDTSYIDCATMQISAEVVKMIPGSMARRCSVLPIKLEHNKLTVAMAEPQDLQVIEELRLKTRREIVPLLAFHDEIVAAIEKHYGPEKTAACAESFDERQVDPKQHPGAMTGLLAPGDKLHVIYRQFFERDVQRHFIGIVQTCTSNLAKVAGYLFARDMKNNTFAKYAPEPRTHIIALNSDVLIINVLPPHVDLAQIVYNRIGPEIRITDGSDWHLDLSHL
jgi:hypothetical protein